MNVESEPRRSNLLPTAVALAALVALVLSVEFPPLVDYPNHVARAVFLAHSQQSALRHFYYAAWTNLPNIGIDVLLITFLHHLSPDAAGILLALVILMGVFASVVYYARIAFGRWTWWSAAGCTAAINGTYLFGFLNFDLSCAEALAFAAAWRVIRPSHRYAATMLLVAATITTWFTHVAGLVFLIILTCSDELLRIVAGTSIQEKLTRLRTSATIFLPSGLAALALYLTSELQSASAPRYIGLRVKHIDFGLALSSYNQYADAAVVLSVALLLCISWMKKALRCDLPSFIALFTCAGLFVVTPVSLKGAYWLDTRFAVMIWLLVFAGFEVEIRSRTQALVTALTSLFICIRLISIGQAWQIAGDQIRNVRTVLTCVPRGSSVQGVVFESTVRANPTLMLSGSDGVHDNATAFAIIDRDAFWPDLFAIPGQQPIRLREEFQSMQKRHGPVQRWRDVVHQSGRSLELGSYATQFDFILVLNASGAVIPPVHGLTHVAGRGEDFARLFSVEDHVPATCASKT
jgi:hypothetical protein